MQSRAGNLAAGGLSMILGLGALTWYYANAVSRPARARHAAQAATNSKAEGEMSLPSLGRVELPRPNVSAAVVANDGSAEPTRSGPLQPALEPLLPAGSPPSRVDAVLPVAVTQNALKPTPQHSFDRRLAGAVFVRQSEGGALRTDVAPYAGGGVLAAQAVRDNDSGAAADRGIAALLRPDATPAVQARVLPNQRFLLPKGAFIDCTLETAIDSTLPGMTTCVTATDTFGVDGSVVLMERGTKLVGETRGGVQQGAARVFVLWTEARTPTGVIVPLDSPGTDELGRSGLAGVVDRHFWDRFGAAILITTIDGVIESAVQSSARTSGTLVLNPAATEGIATEVLKSTVNIAPTVVKKNGERIQVFVARDVDFRSVYDLRAVTAAP